MILHVRVTAEHIAEGRRWDTNWCPIVLAIRDLGYPDVRVRNDEVYQRSYSDTPYAPLPDVARRFIMAFDSGEPVEPFEFDIDHWMQSGCFQ